MHELPSTHLAAASCTAVCAALCLTPDVSVRCTLSLYHSRTWLCAHAPLNQDSQLQRMPCTDKPDADPERCCLQPPPPPPPQSQLGSGSKTVSTAALDSAQAAGPSAVSEGAAAPVPDDSRERPPATLLVQCWRDCLCTLLHPNTLYLECWAQLIPCMALRGRHECARRAGMFPF